MPRFPRFLVLAAALAAATLGVRPAAANPYIWVSVDATVAYGRNGVPVALRQAWRFDDHFSAFAAKGVDRNSDGRYAPEELAAAAALNVAALAKFGYFTKVTAAGRPVALGAPSAEALSYDDGALTLRFTLPLLRAPATEAEPLTVKVFDPAFFIAFALAPGRAVALASAPAGCEVALTRPPQPPRPPPAKVAGLLSRPLDMKGTEGVKYANSATVECAADLLAFAPPPAATPFPPFAPRASAAATPMPNAAMRVDQALRLAAATAVPAVAPPAAALPAPEPAKPPPAPAATAKPARAVQAATPVALARATSGRSAAPVAADADTAPGVGIGARGLILGLLALGLGTLLLGGLLVRGSLMR